MYLISRAPKHTARTGLRQATASSPERAAIGSSSSAGHSAGMPRFLQCHPGRTTMNNVKDTAGSNGKIAVSNPSDASEQEADRVADEVIRTPLTQLQRQHGDA